jgi:hypothetical protein
MSLLFTGIVALAATPHIGASEVGIESAVRPLRNVVDEADRNCEGADRQVTRRSSTVSYGDFNAYWTSGRLFLKQENNYDPRAVEAINRENSLPNLFVVWNPPWLFPLLAPFSAVPFEVAGLLWLVLNVLLTLACAQVIGRRVGLPDFWAWVLGFTYAPIGICLGFSQLSILTLAGVVGYLAARERGRPVLAGLALTLAALKPHIVCLVWLLPLLCGSKSERAKTLVGLTGGLGMLTLIAVAWHPALLGNYLHAIQHPPETPPTGFYSATVGMWLRMETGLHAHVWVQFVPFVLGAAALTWYLVRSGGTLPVFDQIVLAVTLSAVVLPYGWHFDQCVLLPSYLTLWAAALRRNDGRVTPFVEPILPGGLLAVELGQLAMFIAGAGGTILNSERCHVVWPLVMLLLYWHYRSRAGVPLLTPRLATAQ